MNQIKNVTINGIWKNNSVLDQLLGMCPMLAITSTTVSALGLGLITTIVLTITNLSISVLCRWIPSEIRIPIYVMIIASIVSVIQMLIHAYILSLYQSLGIFIPLIVTNCIVLGRAETFATKNNPFISAIDGLITGVKITGVMLILGSIREILGNGTLFDGIDVLLGRYAGLLRIKLYHIDTPFILAILPPSAFIGLGMILAVRFTLKSQIYKIYNKISKFHE